MVKRKDSIETTKKNDTEKKSTTIARVTSCFNITSSIRNKFPVKILIDKIKISPIRYGNAPLFPLRHITSFIIESKRAYARLNV